MRWRVRAAFGSSRRYSGAPAAMMRGTAAIALTLFDHDTPLWLDPRMSGTPDVGKWLKFHTSAPIIADCSICSFALVGDARALPPLDRFAFGTDEYPDRSTTLILQVESLSRGPVYELRGPGIDGTAVLRATIQPEDLFERLAVNATLFPRGDRRRAGGRRCRGRDTPHRAACRQGRLNHVCRRQGWRTRNRECPSPSGA